MHKEQDQAETLRRALGDDVRPRQPHRLRCLGISSGKGGVGKTMVSIGLGYALARMGYRVLILDADVGLANVDLQIGIDPELTLQDVVFGNCSLEDAIVHIPDGPDVLPSVSGAPDMANLGKARRQMLVEELMRFATEYDFFLLDVAAGIGDDVTTFLAAVPEVLMVVANEPTSIMDAYSVIKMLRGQERPPAMTIVVNMVQSLDEGDELAARLNSIVKRFLGVTLPLGGIVVWDELVPRSIRLRKSIMEYAPTSAPSRCLEELGKFVAAGRSASGAAGQAGTILFEKLADVGIQKVAPGEVSL